ncbi:MAG: spermidine/putrescine ABC transporter substrate-binding protein [Clostridia bacterium]|nr:spermidine/putrescine ABC transporter substrate-binding protein [Clostridia bacterium]
MKRYARFILALFLPTLLLGWMTALPVSADEVTLNIYNWGEYLSYDDEECYDVLKEFEKYYEETYGRSIKINYSEFDSNESLYAKIKNGVSGYDVIIPSDYMIARLIDENLLEKLNYENIPNYQYIDDAFKGLYYDPNNEYTVPYTYGRVGIIYNSEMVDKTDVNGTWDLLWNENYRDKILQFNNSRDAFGTAMYKLKLDVNTTDESAWQQAKEELIAQKPILKSFVMDEVFGEMMNGDAAIAAYYAGDYLYMYEDNDALCFYYPEEGSNLFVDAMCVPKGCQNKEAAEIFINFMLSRDAAIANAECTYYASPNSLVYNDPEYAEYMNSIHEDAMDILYPEDFDFHGQYDKYCFKNLDRDTLNMVNGLWEDVKLSDSIGISVYVLCILVIVVIVVMVVRHTVVWKRRSKYYD